MCKRLWLAATAALVLALGGTISAQCVIDSCKPVKQKDGSLVFVQKTYPVAHLLGAADPAQDAELLCDTITRVVCPHSWGVCRGSIGYQAGDHTLTISQTRAVHAQVACLLHGMELVARTARTGPGLAPVAHAVPVPPPCCPTVCCPPVCCTQPCCASAPATPPAPLCCAAAKTEPPVKQYVHLVLDGVKIHTMGVEASVDQVRIMYKGDGIGGDFASCPVLKGTAAKKSACKCDACQCGSKAGCKCGDTCKCPKDGTCACGKECKCGSKTGCKCGEGCKCAKSAAKCGTTCPGAADARENCFMKAKIVCTPSSCGEECEKAKKAKSCTSSCGEECEKAKKTKKTKCTGCCDD